MSRQAQSLASLVEAVRASRGFAHKRDIARVMARLRVDHAAPAMALPNGDDCAALPLPGGGYQLLAIEGLVPEFVKTMPWFAGYSAVMVNLSDVAAMGGRPVAVVDALWSADLPLADEVIRGMQAACRQYGVTLVGGHTNLRSADTQLAVAVLGQARRLISSFAAQPGDRLLVAVDLRGRWEGDAPFWNASTHAPGARLRADLELLAELADNGLCDAGKDISMAGVLGTLLMLLECSGRGAHVRLDSLPVPDAQAGWRGWGECSEPAHAARLRWLCAFPSYGYVLAIRPAHAHKVLERFAAHGIACVDVGQVEPGRQLRVELGDCSATLWDLDQDGFILSGGLGTAQAREGVLQPCLP